MQSQYTTKITKVGEWIAIRRYSGSPRVSADTLTRAYVRYYGSKEFIGAVMQGDLIVIALADSLNGMLPISTNDRLVMGFWGFDIADTTPDLVDGRVTGTYKETAIKSAIKRTLEGKLIALELHAVG